MSHDHFRSRDAGKTVCGRFPAAFTVRLAHTRRVTAFRCAAAGGRHKRQEIVAAFYESKTDMAV
jgi:hypothetical protein